MVMQESEFQPDSDCNVIPIGPEPADMAISQLTQAFGNAELAQDRESMSHIGAVLVGKLGLFAVERRLDSKVQDELNQLTLNAINAHIRVQSGDESRVTSFASILYPPPVEPTLTEPAPELKTRKSSTKDKHTKEMVYRTDENGKLKIMFVTKPAADILYPDALRVEYKSVRGKGKIVYSEPVETNKTEDVNTESQILDDALAPYDQQQDAQNPEVSPKSTPKSGTISFLRPEDQKSSWPRPPEKVQTTKITKF